MNRYLFEKGQTFSIRKLTVGIASVMVGLAFFASGTALAEEAKVNSTSSPQNVEKLSDPASKIADVKTENTGPANSQEKMRKQLNPLKQNQ